MVSRKPRKATSEEQALFEAVVDGKALPEQQAPAAQELLSPPLLVPKPRLRRPTGIDGRTAERLRKGTIEPDSKLDLHGFTEASAHNAVTAFLRSEIRKGARLLLIITGKGLRSPQEDEAFDFELQVRKRGVLRSMVPRWLHEPEFVRFVADVRTAHQRHGGAGALYVYLRKDRKQL